MVQRCPESVHFWNVVGHPEPQPKSVPDLIYWRWDREDPDYNLRLYPLRKNIYRVCPHRDIYWGGGNNPDPHSTLYDNVVLRDSTVFFILGVQSYAAKKLRACQQWLFAYADVMRNLLVPLEEVADVMKKLDARTFWAAFPSFDSPGRYTYSIMVDKYKDEKCDDLCETRATETTQVEEWAHPLFQEVEMSILTDEQRNRVLGVGDTLRSWEKEGYPMIKEWRFVTWNESIWNESIRELKAAATESGVSSSLFRTRWR